MQPDLILVALLLAAALAVGGGLGWFGIRLLLRRLAAPATPSPFAGRGAPTVASLPLAGEARVWLLPDAPTQRALLLWLAQRGAEAVPVLVVPAAGSRAWLAQALTGQAAVSWLPEDRPPSGELLYAAHGLHHGQPPLVLVQGLEALQQADDDEPQDAPLAELLSLRPPELGVVVLCTPDDPLSEPPDLRLELDGTALVGPGGKPRLELGELPGDAPC